MRAAWAVIADSFRAATSSKVLWVATAVIYVVLFFLALAGFREKLTSDFAAMDIRNGTRLKALLAEPLADGAEPSARSGIVESLDEDIRRSLQQVARGEDTRIRYDTFVGSLNQLLDNDDWYDPQRFEGLTRDAERSQLERLGDDELNEDRRRRLRRLRLESALPGVFAARPPISIRPTYAGIDFPVDLPVTRARFEQLINQFVLPTIISWLLGFVLVFLGIVVTAPIIPGMLQPGSLHLLLSKPVSRTNLLLSKFVGGCAFMLLCVTQLVIGLYLVAGFRFEIWNWRLLWCIPTSVLLFSVFYSVSVLAGLIFRSEVLSIGLTCAFGGVCLVTGFIGGLFDGFVTGRDRVVAIRPLADELLVQTSGRKLHRWDNDQWQSVYPETNAGSDRIVAPIAVPMGPKAQPAIATTRIVGGRFNAYGFGPPDLQVFDPSEGWGMESKIRLPASTTQLINLDDQFLLALNTSGLHAVRMSVALRGDDRDEDAADEISLYEKLTRMMGRSSNGFKDILPSGVRVSMPRAIATRPRTTDVWVASGSKIWRIRPPEPEQDEAARWTVEAEADLEGGVSETIHMDVTGRHVVVIRPQTGIRVLDAESLETRRSDVWEDAEDLLALRALSDERFVTLTTDGTAEVWLVDQSLSTRGGPRQRLPYRNVEAIATGTNHDRLLLAHRVDTVVELDPDSFEPLRRYAPSLKVWRMVERYVVAPLRFVIPQTGELGSVIASAISGESAAVIGDPADSETPLARYHLARPLLSCSGFIIAMMMINVWYFRKQDF